MRFVILFALACGHRDAPAREPTRPPVTDAGIAVARDAAPDAAPDASETPPSDAPADAPLSVEQPSPPVLVGKIIAVSVDDDHSILTVDVGKRRGVDNHWHATLLDDSDRRVERLELVTVSDSTCRVRSKLPSDVVRGYHRVAFEP